MNIGIDITHYNRLSGYGVVARNIIKGLLTRDQENFYYLFSHEKKDLEDIKYYKKFQFINTHQSFIWYKFFSLPYYLKKYDIDIFISLDQDLPLRKVCTYICVSHDIGAQIKGKRNIIKQLLMRGTDKIDRIYHLFDLEKIALNNADFVITPSLHTKNDIIRLYHIPANKIIVSYWWIDHLVYGIHEDKSDYILFPYSNLYSNFQYMLANAIVENAIASKVIFLRPAFAATIPLHPDVEVIAQRISDADNQKYFKQALVSVYLSDYDGFGFVPLESNFYYTPVVYNIHSCMLEIIKDSGIWIKELDVVLFIDTIHRLLNDKHHYNELLSKWKENNNRFTWKKTVDIFLSLINR